MVTNRMGHPRCSSANPNRLEHELRACSMLCSIVFRPFLLGGARHAEFTLLPVVVTGSVRGGGPIRRPTLLPVRRLRWTLRGRRPSRTPPAETTRSFAKQGETRSPLTDSNRRPPLYEEGRCVKSSVVVSPSQGGRGGGGWRAVLISLSPPRVGGHGRWECAPVAQLLRDRQAARGSVAPLGAKGWLRVSMCQIASVSRRARSICATLAPRCLPMRAFMCW